MEQRLYSAARVGEATGVTRQYINRYCKEHCPDAKIGTKIDINHPVMHAFMESKGADMSAQLKPAEERTSHLATTPVSQRESKLSISRRGNGTQSEKPRPKITANQNKTVEQVDISDHGNLTLNELVAYFGSDESYRGWLQAKKTQVEIVEREIKVEEKTGEVVKREAMKKSVFGFLEEMNSRLLVDSAVTIATKIYAHCESGDTIEEATKTVRGEISKPIQNAKAQIVRNIGAE
ncbi:coil containing protein [Vibrio phage 1.124.O._10N.286.49.B1]|nr:coil containing protein [Vibrio phage 1.124.O._10N.286.49.B1]